MKASDIPAKFPIPFASGALPSLIRSIPTAGAQPNGGASLTDGFPATAFQPVASGGIPPAGQDMNGLMMQVTGWARWLAAGGPIFYDAQFSSAIGGYPNGVILQSIATPGNMWRNTVDNNTTDPDSNTQSGWVLIVTNGFVPVQQGGGGFGQLNNKIYVGWTDGNGLHVTVDATDLGSVVFEAELVNEVNRAKTAESALAAALQLETDSRIQNDASEVAVRFEQDQIASAYYKNNNTALNQNPNGSAEWGMSGGNLIIQWGSSYTDGNGLCRVDFPGNFPVGCFSLNATVSGATTYEPNYLNVSAAAYNGFEVFTMNDLNGAGGPSPFVNFYWMAIGY